MAAETLANELSYHAIRNGGIAQALFAFLQAPMFNLSVVHSVNLFIDQLRNLLNRLLGREHRNHRSTFRAGFIVGHIDHTQSRQSVRDALIDILARDVF